MYAACYCGWDGEVPLRVGKTRTLHKCLACKLPVTTVSTFQWAEWMERRADSFEKDQVAGKLGSRRQSRIEGERDISVAGLGAELAACLILCPWQLTTWQQNSLANVPNRGRDFPREWFADGRPVEVKFTAYEQGHLIVRPPAGKVRLSMDDIEDSIYVLMVGKPHTYTLAGWAGKSDLRSKGVWNPVPKSGRQRECIGIHASKLNDPSSLFWILSHPRKSSR